MVKPIYIFGIDRSVQNEVGPETYGLYFVLLNFTFLFQIINDFGLQIFNSREIAQDKSLIPVYLPNILLIKAGLASLFISISLGACYLLGYLPLHKDLLIWIIINHVLVSFLFYMRSNIAGMGKYHIDSLLSIADRVIMIIILGSILLMAPEKMNITLFVRTQSLALLLPILAGSVYVLKTNPVFGYKVDIDLISRILRQSWPYGMLIFLMTLYTRVDAVMLKELHPSANLEAGIYAAAYRLLDAVNMTGFLMAGLLIPMFASLLKQELPFIPLLKTSSLVGFAIAIPTSILVYLYRTEIAMLLYHDANEYWGDVLGILMCSFVATMGTYIFGSLFTANANLKALNYLALGAIALNIAFNAILIPKYGASGAAFSTVITQYLYMTGQMILGIRLFDLNVNLNAIFKLGALVVYTFAVSSFSKHLFPQNWVLALIWDGILIVGLLLLVFKKDLAQFIRLYLQKRNNNQ